MEKSIIETLVDKIEGLLQEAYEETKLCKYYNKGIKDWLALIRQESARQRKQEEYFSKENTMEKEIKITPPEGFEIDNENSTFECIRFKPVQKKRWRDDTDAQIKGYYISYGGYISDLLHGKNLQENYCVFATEKQAKSALAMARISQIMANDERFGGVVTDEEWNNPYLDKFVIERCGDKIRKNICWSCYDFLAFHTAIQRNLFLQENEDLVRDYLCL